jgi:hypothetical protein
MTEKKDDRKLHRDSFAIVGELVLISNALDYMLAQVLIEVLDLDRSPMLMAVIVTLDPARKLEILKGRAKHIAHPDWKKGVSSFVDKAERVYKYRNIACHTQPIFDRGKWTLQPFAAAKVFKDIDLTTRSIKPTSFDTLKTAIATGEAALGSGVNLIENFRRFNAEKARRAQPQQPSSPGSDPPAG